MSSEVFGGFRYVAAKTFFFRDSIRLPDLNNRMAELTQWCTNFADQNGFDLDARASTVNR